MLRGATALVMLALLGGGCAKVDNGDSRPTWLTFEGDFASLRSARGIKADPLLAANRRAVSRFLREAASQYPVEFIGERMPSVLVVQSLHRGGERLSGTFVEPDLVILSVDLGNIYMLQASFHHEVCHYLLHRHRHALSWGAWRNITSRHGAQDGFVPDDRAWRMGFVSQYAMTAIDEDVASTWAAAFADAPDHRAIPWSEYRILVAKLRLIKEFAMRVHPSFDDEYFRRTEPFASVLYPVRAGGSLRWKPPSTPNFLHQHLQRQHPSTACCGGS